MRWSVRRRAIRVAAAVAALAVGVVLSWPQEPTPPAQEGTPVEEATVPSTEPEAAARAKIGEKFPALTLTVLPPKSEKTAPLDLAADLGKRPVVFVYFLLTSPVSEEVMTEVFQFAEKEAKGKVAVYPVVRLGKRFEITELAERMRLLGVDAPVITDEEGRLQKILGVGSVPSIALIDGTGALCFVRASSLKHPILGEVDVRESIRIAARGEEPPTVFNQMPYFPASDLVGERFRDFVLPEHGSGRDLRLADHVKEGRLTALLYWSPACRFSRWTMPAFVAGHRTYGGKYLDLISVVRGAGSADVGKYADENKIAFPILDDRGKRFTSLYRVVSTPTLILIRPDGIVDSVYTDGKVNYFPVLMTKIRTLVLKPGAPAAPAPASPAPASPPPVPSKPNGS